MSARRAAVPGPPQDTWSPAIAEKLYGVNSWGKGYFAVNEKGNVEIRPTKDPLRSIDLHEMIVGLSERGLDTPVLLRFTDVLSNSINEIHQAFQLAIEDEEYQNQYSCLYPIKVNQQRAVVEAIRGIGEGLGLGLEAGSKAELLAVLGLTVDQPEMLIVCNGFKDREYVETVILATKLGRNIIPVVEKFSDLELLLEFADKHHVHPQIGVRVKLSSRGAGRWKKSGGARSKFGLFVSELLEAFELLKSRGMEDCFKLLHFHVGSQICDIRAIKNAVTEFAHIYAELRQLGAGLEMIDVGGGLGVDYDGSQSASDSSMNYTVEQYAADVIYRIKSACDDADVPHPMVLSESGRAMVAYGSVLVFDVVDTATYDVSCRVEEVEATLEGESEVPQPLLDLLQAVRDLEQRDVVEVYQDAVAARDELLSLFGLGYASLKVRAAGDRLYWYLASEVLKRMQNMEEIPGPLADLPERLSDVYFCNVSVFQSLPDSWAIDQLFPICPIHRLDEPPTRRGVLADLTCDSDGMIDRFPSMRRGDKQILELHPVERNGPRYYLAAFLVGAYQETLGALHNLFGDTHAVHISVGDDGAQIDDVICGDTVSEVLSYVQINAKELSRSMRRDVERAVRAGRMTPAQAGSLVKFFDSGLDGYTYLV
ncbi:MAG: biosynthetic arginine decarboxylase [Planctomycetes bacterium]|nr:biosynthetic arginine decarboxylase [Planctomycetota bacterium]